MPKTTLIILAGSSCTGKSTFVSALCETVENVCTISQDEFYDYDSFKDGSCPKVFWRGALGCRAMYAMRQVSGLINHVTKKHCHIHSIACQIDKNGHTWKNWESPDAGKHTPDGSVRHFVNEQSDTQMKSMHCCRCPLAQLTGAGWFVRL